MTFFSFSLVLRRKKNKINDNELIYVCTTVVILKFSLFSCCHLLRVVIIASYLMPHIKMVIYCIVNVKFTWYYLSDERKQKQWWQHQTVTVNLFFSLYFCLRLTFEVVKNSPCDILLGIHAHVTLHVVLLTTEYTQRNEQLAKPCRQCIDSRCQIAAEFEKLQTICESIETMRRTHLITQAY